MNWVYFALGWFFGMVITCAFLCIVIGGSCDR